MHLARDHCARDPSGFACIVQRILMDLHALCKGSLWLCMNFARDPNGPACFLQGNPIDEFRSLRYALSLSEDDLASKVDKRKQSAERRKARQHIAGEAHKRKVNS